MDKLIDWICSAVLFVGAVCFVGGIGVILVSLFNSLGR
jgi:hypothetical protein